MQLDIYGDLSGILMAHPVAPILSLHHLDLIEPVFPKMDRVKAVKRLMVPMKLDSAGLIQQSICYDKTRSWTVSVSWGYAVQIYRGIIAAKEMSVPARTFIDWNFGDEDVYFSFNTRPISTNPCQKPFVYYLSNALFNLNLNRTASEYVRHQESNSDCDWKIADPSRIKRIEVYKKPDPHLWDKVINYGFSFHKYINYISCLQLIHVCFAFACMSSHREEIVAGYYRRRRKGQW